RNASQRRAATWRRARHPTVVFLAGLPRRYMMSPIVDDVIEQIRGAWRYRWLALAAAWLVCIGGWLFVFSLPDIYEASAKVYVDTRTALRPLLQGIAVEADVESQLALVRQALLGRPQLEKVAQETDLYEPGMTPQQRASFIDTLRTRITIKGGGGRD